MSFNHQEIEKKWQKYWEENKTFKTTEDKGKRKFYALDMFPYPSGAGLHVGHPEGYTATDIFSRMKRMQGYNVLHPMGWDAFGLPAEQYALIQEMIQQNLQRKTLIISVVKLNHLGFSYDWDREINTTDPDYYKWTQWIFLKLYEKGLPMSMKFLLTGVLHLELFLQMKKSLMEKVNVAVILLIRKSNETMDFEYYGLC